MKAHVETRQLVDFSCFGDLAALGTPWVGVDLALARGYVLPAGAFRTPRSSSGAVAVLISHAGSFGWRLTDRQARALARAGFVCRSWK